MSLLAPFQHKSCVFGVLFVLWVFITFIVTAIDSGKDDNTNLSKSKWFQLVSLLLLAFYGFMYWMERNGRF